MSRTKQATMDLPSEVAPQEEQQQQTRKRSRRQPPYAVVVLNDDEHTFPYVIVTLRKVFGYDETKGFELAQRIHNEGRAVVWSGWKEIAELKRDQIRSAGPDIFAEQPVTFPLGVVLEPMPT